MGKYDFIFRVFQNNVHRAKAFSYLFDPLEGWTATLREVIAGILTFFCWISYLIWEMNRISVLKHPYGIYRTTSIVYELLVLFFLNRSWWSYKGKTSSSRLLNLYFRQTQSSPFNFRFRKSAEGFFCFLLFFDTFHLL